METDKEYHIFRATLGFSPKGKSKLTVVSWDGTIVYVMDADAYWVSQFNSGEHKIYVKGYFDLNDRMIYLGEKIDENLAW